MSRSPALLLLALAACDSGSAPSPLVPPAGLTFEPGTTPGSSLTLDCFLNRCGSAPLSFSVRVVSTTAVAAATVRSRFLDAGGRECAFVFAPRQDVAAGLPVTFGVSRVLMTETAAGRLACRPPFTTTTVDMGLLDGAGAGVLSGQASASYTFVLPPGVTLP